MTSFVMTEMPTAITNIRHYQAQIERYPRLDEAEERRLAERLRDRDDVDAAWKLVSSHLRYVVYLARRYSGYGLPQEDLIQEGNLGLLKAVRRFDPSHNARLITYASHWIRAQIHDYVLKNWRIVKVATTKAKRKLFYKLRSEKKHLEWLTDSEAQAIAQHLNVNTDDVIDMDGAMYLSDKSFDQSMDDDSWGPVDYLSDEEANPELIVAESEYSEKARRSLHDGLDSLDQRSREILQSRWLVDESEKTTLHELAQRYGLSAERIRQIEATAIDRLRDVMVPQLDDSIRAMS